MLGPRQCNDIPQPEHGTTKWRLTPNRPSSEHVIMALILQPKRCPVRAGAGGFSCVLLHSPVISWILLCSLALSCIVVDCGGFVVDLSCLHSLAFSCIAVDCHRFCCNLLRSLSVVVDSLAFLWSINFGSSDLLYIHLRHFGSVLLTSAPNTFRAFDGNGRA